MSSKDLDHIHLILDEELSEADQAELANEIFLRELDSMIEATEEFIGDDGLRSDDERIHDLSALLRVRDLWVETFGPEAQS